MLLTGLLLVSLSRQWGTPKLLVSLSDSRITESSGIAASPTLKDTYYTHNDSGDSARFFRFKKSGIDAEFKLSGTKAIDWEDMASARLNGKSWIYLGDIGDNQLKRKSITIYRVEEPKSGSATLAKFDTLECVYPDGSHNCEAMFVAPGSGDIYLVTKDEKESMVFVLKKPRARAINKFEKLGSLFVNTGLGKYGRLITGADCDPRGRYVVIRTYSGILEYAVKGDFQGWWKSKPSTLPVALEPQGEAICYLKNDEGILTSSEGNPCPIHQVLLEK